MMRRLVLSLLFISGLAFGLDYPASVHRTIVPTVTTTASNAIGQNDSRKYLQVQNNDPTLILYVDAGTVATTAGSIVLNPGQAWAPLSVPTGPISLIGNSGSNTKVIVTEGR